MRNFFSDEVPRSISRDTSKKCVILSRNIKKAGNPLSRHIKKREPSHESIKTVQTELKPSGQYCNRPDRIKNRPDSIEIVRTELKLAGQT